MSILNLAIDLSDKIYGIENRDSEIISEIEQRLFDAFEKGGWPSLLAEEAKIEKGYKDEWNRLNKKRT